MTRMQHSFAALLALVAVGFMANFAAAQDCCGGPACGAAACGSGCCDSGQTCNAQCIDVHVKVKCFACKCEDFCIPGPSCRDCKHCETACAAGCADSCCNGGCTDSCAGGCGDSCCGGSECGSDCGCGHAAPEACPKKFVWYSWIPGCAQVHTRKKLMMKVETKTIKSHTWNTTCGCGGAGCGACGGGLPATGPAPSMGVPTPAGDEDMLPPAPPPVTRRAPVSQIRQTSGVLNYYE